MWNLSSRLVHFDPRDARKPDRGGAKRETRHPIAAIVLIAGLHKTRRCPGEGLRAGAFSDPGGHMGL